MTTRYNVKATSKTTFAVIDSKSGREILTCSDAQTDAGFTADGEAIAKSVCALLNMTRFDYQPAIVDEAQVAYQQVPAMLTDLDEEGWQTGFCHTLVGSDRHNASHEDEFSIDEVRAALDANGGTMDPVILRKHETKTDYVIERAEVLRGIESFGPAPARTNAPAPQPPAAATASQATEGDDGEEKIYTVEMIIAGTAYIRATDAKSAVAMAKTQTGADLTVNEDNDMSADLPITGMRLDSPSMPAMSLSPAMMVLGVGSFAEASGA